MVDSLIRIELPGRPIMKIKCPLNRENGNCRMGYEVVQEPPEIVLSSRHILAPVLKLPDSLLESSRASKLFRLLRFKAMHRYCAKILKVKLVNASIVS